MIFIRFLTSLPVRLNLAEGRKQLMELITIDEKSGKSKRIERILINDDHMFFDRKTIEINIWLFQVNDKIV